MTVTTVATPLITLYLTNSTEGMRLGSQAAIQQIKGETQVAQAMWEHGSKIAMTAVGLVPAILKYYNRT